MVGYFDMVKYGTTNGYNCYGNLASTMVGYKYKYIYIYKYRMGHPKIAFRCLISVAEQLWFMVDITN
jgi:hypothetical protein